MKKFLILFLSVLMLISIFSISLMATNITDDQAINVVKDTNVDILVLLSLAGLGIRSIQVNANSFTHKNIIYNKGAIIEVDELEAARLLGSYPFALQVPLGGSPAPVAQPAPQPAASSPPSTGPITTADLKAGGKKIEAPVPPKVKSDEDLLNEMLFKDIKKLAKSLQIKIPFGVSKAKLIKLVIEKSK